MGTRRSSNGMALGTSESMPGRVSTTRMRGCIDYRNDNNHEYKDMIL